MISDLFSRFYISLILLASATGQVSLKAESGPPNIVFILVDDLGWGDLGVFYQNYREEDRKHATPMLDQFAAEGMQLRQHYCPAPVCAPSRASLLSGRHQGHEPIRDNQFDKALANSHTLGTVLQTAGYRTALVGKYGLPGGDREKYDFDEWVAYPTKRGFDEFFGYVKHRDGHTQYPAHEYKRGDSELHRTGKPIFHNDKKLQTELTGCYTTDLFTAFSKKWIIDHRRNNPKQPFFLYLSHSTPHAALHVPTSAYPAGGGLNGGVQWLGSSEQMINTARQPIDSWIHPDYADKNWTEIEKRFATSVRRIDSSVADIVHTLRDLNIDRETIIVFSSDNGPHKESYIEGLSYEASSFNSFGKFNGIKRDVLEGGIRMPTLVRWPGHIPAGALNQSPSQFHDWLPTFATLAEVASPALSDGVSLLPFLTGQGTPQKSTIYTEYFNSSNTPNYDAFEDRHKDRQRKQMQVVMVDGYKGIRTNIESHDDNFEIYDLNKDYRESQNLADSSDYFTELQSRMKARVLQIRRPNDSAPRPYDDVFVPGVDPDLYDNDVSWRAFEGNFPWVPQTAQLQPIAQGKSSEINLDMRTRDHDIAIEFKGFVRARRDAEYTFKVDSDSGAILRVHDAVVVDNESTIDGKRQAEGKILLQKGVHPYTLIYSRGNRGQPRLKVSYSR